MQWYYAIDGQRYGPVEEEALLALVREQKLRPKDLVWNETLGDQWAQAGRIPKLFPMAPPAVPSTTGTGGKTPNRELMAQARAVLKGRWGFAIGVCVLNTVLLMGAQVIPLLGWLISLLVTGPLMVGLMGVFLRLGRQQEARVSGLFDGFRQFGQAVGAYFLMALFTFLWTLPGLGIAALGVGSLVSQGLRGGGGMPVVGVTFLAIGLMLAMIATVIVQLRYFQTYFVLADESEVGPLQAIRRSIELMGGRKWKLFCLGWRFFGWAVLCVLTFGIGFFWLMPYMMASYARFYDDLLKPAGQP